MKTIIVRLLLAALVLTAADRLSAQIVDVNQFKFTVYNQTNSAPPAAPNFPDAYFFGTYIDTDAGTYVSNVVVYPPDYGELPLNQFTPTYFENSSPYYSNETNLDADYPGGTYDYNFDCLDAASNVINADLYFDISAINLYPDAVPAFTPGCWTAMRHVDPAQDFILSWNSYGLTPGADYAYTFLSVSDHDSGIFAIGPSGPPEITSTNIPADTLEYGRVYDVGLYFSERQTPAGGGIGAGSITAGWDYLTQTTLFTIPPWLKIAPAGANVILTWPALAANYQLEKTTSLSATSTWNAVTNVPDVNGTTNVLTLPTTNGSAFFRLAPLGF
ncbi:MAG: hypothetical protein WDM80_06350 [Limisphaerales bacterium]